MPPGENYVQIPGRLVRKNLLVTSLLSDKIPVARAEILWWSGPRHAHTSTNTPSGIPLKSCDDKRSIVLEERSLVNWIGKDPQPTEPTGPFLFVDTVVSNG